MNSRRSYLWLLGAVVAAAFAVTLLARIPGWRAPDATEPSAAPRPVSIVLEVRDGVLSPGTVQVTKGDRIALSVRNAGSTRTEISLPGYDDRWPAFTIEPGATWTGDLLADRPGDDFAWVVNGRPTGRLVVAGSHLVEGHQ